MQLDTSGINLNRTPSFPDFEESCDFDTAFSYSSTNCQVTYFKVTVTDPNDRRYVMEWIDVNENGSWSMAEVTSESEDGNYGKDLGYNIERNIDFYSSDFPTTDQYLYFGMYTIEI